MALQMICLHLSLRRPILSYLLGVAVGTAEGYGLVQRAQAFHLLPGEREVEHVQVLPHAVSVRALGDGDDVPLQQVAQGHLLRGLAIFLRQAG